MTLSVVIVRSEKIQIWGFPRSSPSEGARPETEKWVAPPVAVATPTRREKGGAVDRLTVTRAPSGARVRRQEAKAAAVKMPHHAGRGLLLPPRKREEARGEEKGWRHSSPSLAGGQARQLTHTKASPAAAATVSEKRREREKQLGF